MCGKMNATGDNLQSELRQSGRQKHAFSHLWLLSFVWMYNVVYMYHTERDVKRFQRPVGPTGGEGGKRGSRRDGDDTLNGPYLLT